MAGGYLANWRFWRFLAGILAIFAQGASFMIYFLMAYQSSIPYATFAVYLVLGTLNLTFKKFAGSVQCAPKKYENMRRAKKLLH